MFLTVGGNEIIIFLRLSWFLLEEYHATSSTIKLSPTIMDCISIITTNLTTTILSRDINSINSMFNLLFLLNLMFSLLLSSMFRFL